MIGALPKYALPGAKLFISQFGFGAADAALPGLMAAWSRPLGPMVD